MISAFNLYRKVYTLRLPYYIDSFITRKYLSGITYFGDFGIIDTGDGPNLVLGLHIKDCYIYQGRY